MSIRDRESQLNKRNALHYTVDCCDMAAPRSEVYYYYAYYYACVPGRSLHARITCPVGR